VGYRIGLAGAVVASLLLAGCGGSSVRSGAPNAATLAADYRGAPAPLAGLFAKRNSLLGGGTPAFARELRALRGYPVVVNKWASWCDNCLEEFTVFQEVAPRYGRRVAFLGDDWDDGGGHSWLAKHPLSFPSYEDHSGSIDQLLGPASASYAPVTYFYDRRGKQVYFHYGPYLSAASLAHDIRLYLGA